MVLFLKLDSRYEVTQDVKGQLKFLEELDRVERKRHEEQERELLLRAAKSRSKSEDPEQVKLKAKAKEVSCFITRYLYKLQNQNTIWVIFMLLNDTNNSREECEYIILV